MNTKDKVLTFFISMGLISLLCCLSAHADPSPLPSGLPVIPVLAKVNVWSGWLQAFSIGGAAVTMGGFLEIVLRLIPSKEPLSLAYAFADFAHAFGKFFENLGNALDKILPNRVKAS